MPLSNDFIAGALAGAAGVAVGHPFDTIKVQIQTQEYGGRYKSLMECFRTVQRQSLSKGFFRGMSWPIVTYSGLGSVFFGSYGFALTQIYGSAFPAGGPSYPAICAASAFGVLPQLIVACPTEVIKINLQSQIPHSISDGSKNPRRHFSGPTEAVRTIVKKAGIQGMYRGFWTQLAGDIPAHILYMTSFVFFQNNIRKTFPSLPSEAVSFIGGGFAGIVCCTVTLPLDVIKSKIQADTSQAFYKGFFDCARKVYISDGPRAFFLGFVPVCLQSFPVNAITLMVYSESLLYFKKWRYESE